ncbi:Uncharacterized conserved protein, Alpha-E superfamily [Ectothiorhodosinus mongolicus]|uniref:Uncharacterized conserved protein, Alpha-E superfamily n=1 Tax=Ectothiorhodosinus mongolicus TaxID=233100 RepID=A0A1R3VNJ9_9GAMM|nr:alpha-E domain-containing protein [Ectothiorhodosinus mongolicus]ULX56509.1 alpha-E domain-containing protein [Ectothiorhodosinus mongolicus]SIT66168.1 Uncharacterized conserved protein, Alpha-E superfamily [Ectothiorhodosinus mongolicus]
MLSRVAERLYWLARYLERAEGTARMVTAYNHLALDMPVADRLAWAGLVSITGSEDLFEARFSGYTEAKVIKFLLGDKDNPGSIMNSLSHARENVRTTRDLLPSEVWEAVNELHLFARSNLDSGWTKRGRYHYLSQIRSRCQQITGMLAGTMSHDHAYHFIRLGRNLERADMTSRLLDVAAVSLLQEDEDKDADGAGFEGLLWVNILKSLSASQMYRQHVRRGVNASDVLHFLFHDKAFPRAMAHALGEVESSLAQLPRNDVPLRMAIEIKRHALQSDIERLLEPKTLHAFIDEMQQEMAELHSLISETWFSLDRAA